METTETRTTAPVSGVFAMVVKILEETITHPLTVSNIPTISQQPTNKGNGSQPDSSR